MTAILLCGEGPHDVGLKEWDSKTGEHAWREGWMQPLVRKVHTSEIEIKTKYLKELVLFPRPKALQPTPKGQRDKAAIARLVARLEGCAAVIYMTDADTNAEPERQAKVTEIKEGFAIIDNKVACVACVPKSASESWLLSDLAAWQALGLAKQANWPKSCPEDLWGGRHDPTSNHPKHAFSRVAEDAGLSDGRDTRRQVSEDSSLQTMKRRCPTSLCEFVDELEEALK